MDEELAPLASDANAEFREAVYWWMRLREHGLRRRTLIGFERWLTASTAHRLAFARVEALREMVQRASPKRAATSARRAAPRAGNTKRSIP